MESYLPLLLRLALATTLGAVIGLERHVHGRPAGLRTNALVCLASALLILVSRTGALEGIHATSHFMLNVDPARMAAGIVTGIGFLGAGAILKIRENVVTGLTTAACVWFVAAIGVTTGLGEYLLATVATLLALFVLVFLDRVERNFGAVTYATLIVLCDMSSSLAVEQRCSACLSQKNISVKKTSYRVDTQAQRTRMLLNLRLKEECHTREIIHEIANFSGVLEVEWI